jgi:small multidrug resistance pump
MPAALFLALAILCEVGATLALRASDGLTRPIPVAIVIVGYVISFWLLSLALRDISVSMSYAIWSGVGTALIAVAGVAVFGETMNALKFASLALIVIGVAGLSAAGGGAH